MGISTDRHPLSFLCGPPYFTVSWGTGWGIFKVKICTFLKFSSLLRILLIQVLSMRVKDSLDLGFINAFTRRIARFQQDFVVSGAMFAQIAEQSFPR